MRLFVAVSPPEPVRVAASRLARPFRPLVQGTFVKPDNMHITLAFLGDVEDAARVCFIDALDALTLESAPVCLDRLDAFSRKNIPTVLHAAGADEALRPHADAVRQSAASCGIPMEDRPFRLHLTLCRIRKVLNPSVFTETLRQQGQQVAPMTFTADSIRLVKSRLTPSGPVYTEIFKKTLRTP